MRCVGKSALGGTFEVVFADLFEARLGSGQAAFVLDSGLLLRGFANRGQRIRELIKGRLAVDFLI